MKLLIAVVVYDRLESIQNWLIAWKKILKPYSAKLAVIHNYDLSMLQKSAHSLNKQRDLILSYKPDYYIERINIQRDIGAFKDTVDSKLLNEFDLLGWFTDDFIPMKKDFLFDFTDKIIQYNVGLVGACYEPVNKSNKYEHFRTVGFMGKVNHFRKLKFPEPSPQYSFEMEHGPNNLTLQIKNMGLKAVPAIGNEYPNPGYSHWPNNSNWMWDSHSLSDLNLINKFNTEFK